MSALTNNSLDGKDFNLVKRIQILLTLLVLLSVGLSAQQPFNSVQTKKPGIIAHRGFH